jgi:hypothetical protein
MVKGNWQIPIGFVKSKFYVLFFNNYVATIEILLTFNYIFKINYSGFFLAIRQIVTSYRTTELESCENDLVDLIRWQDI